MITFIFGDSITEGLWDSKGGWADRIKAYVQAEEVKSGIKNYNEVYNLGVDGNTTKQLLERFEVETKARLWPDEEYAFIFAIGTNDTLHRNNAEFESTPERYENELNQLTTLAQKYSSKIIFVDLLPVDESLTNPIKSSSTGKCYTNERISLFNQTLYNFCEGHSLLCIKINETFEQDYKNLLTDGIHPNDEGHELIANTIKPNLKELL
jgi:lysophospholipase L1-like esterase